MNGEYRSYLKTKRWRRVRAAMLSYVGHKCERCGEHEEDGAKLEVHHRHYLTVKKEEPRDLDVLCGRCHLFAETANTEQLANMHAEIDSKRTYLSFNDWQFLKRVSL